MKLNWKLMLMLTLVNGAAIAFTTWLLPGIVVDRQVMFTYLILGAVFGLLNAFVKPIVQFLTISLLFVTYGLVMIIVNTIVFLLLELILPDLLVIENIWWAIAGGTMVSLLGILLENLFGLSPPIIDRTAEPALAAPDQPAVEGGKYDSILEQVKQLKQEVPRDEN